MTDLCDQPGAEDCYYRMGEECNWWNDQIRLAKDQKAKPCEPKRIKPKHVDLRFRRPEGFYQKEGR